jgi:hypothetical protein
MNIPAVPEISSSTGFILISACAGMLVLVLGQAIGISRRLRRIEQWLVEVENRRESAVSDAGAAEKPVGGAFEEFLKEDPKRMMLSKGEQASEYRKWRQEKGLNWSNS